jgi:pimeloyl-ACP methyl ester carboxylesterase
MPLPAVRDHEARGVGELLADGFGQLTTRIEELHHAIAGRVFGGVGAPGVPVRVAHDAIAAGVYGTVRLIGSAVTRAGGLAVAVTRPQDADLVTRSPRAALGVAAISGLIGDRMDRGGNPLAPRMTLRPDGEPTPKIALFVHGLCEDDAAWQLGSKRLGGATYGSSLRADFGYTPVFVRYNSGLPIADNGRRLGEQLEALVADWPVEVEELLLVGHSMGGLVLRSAAHQAEPAGQQWTGRVRHVVHLGTPHLGAPLEQAVDRLVRVLDKLPETAPVAKVLAVRSTGIKDLRRGLTVAHLEGAQHYAICATLAKEPKGLYAGIVGDLLVLEPSGSGRGTGGDSVPFDADKGRHFGGVNHFQLLNHPAVYAQLRTWLEAGPSG